MNKLSAVSYQLSATTTDYTVHVAVNGTASGEAFRSSSTAREGLISSGTGHPRHLNLATGMYDDGK